MRDKTLHLQHTNADGDITVKNYKSIASFLHLMVTSNEEELWDIPMLDDKVVVARKGGILIGGDYETVSDLVEILEGF